jgi:RNA polymerase sigma factor (sigma-70 family)
MTEESDSSARPGEHATQLCEQIIAGDQAAANQFVAQHFRWLLFIVRNKFRNTDLHMDIVQDAFMLVITKLQNNEVRQLHTIKAFLRTCAINIGHEYLRKNQKFSSSMAQEQLDWLADQQTGILDQLAWQDGVQQVKQVMQELPTERDREILTLFYFEDRSKHSICEHLSLTPAHFDRVIYRARQRLKELIHGQGGSFGDPQTLSEQPTKKPKARRNLLNRLAAGAGHLINQVLRPWQRPWRRRTA